MNKSQNYQHYYNALNVLGVDMYYPAQDSEAIKSYIENAAQDNTSVEKAPQASIDKAAVSEPDAPLDKPVDTPVEVAETAAKAIPSKGYSTGDSTANSHSNTAFEVASEQANKKIANTVEEHVVEDQAATDNATQTTPAPIQHTKPQVINKRKDVIDDLGNALINKFDSVELDDDINELEQKVLGCEACSLSMGRKQVIFGKGQPGATIMVVTDPPSAMEDNQNKVMSDKSMALLSAMLNAINLTVDDVFITNVVKCHSPHPLPSVGDEVEQCRNHLEKQLQIIEPDLIWVLGEFAAKVMTQTDAPLAELRGKPYKYRMASGNIMVDNSAAYRMIVSYHPLHLLQNPEDKKVTWQDLKYISKFLASKSAKQAD